jgi:hypothetical protein
MTKKTLSCLNYLQTRFKKGSSGMSRNAKQKSDGESYKLAIAAGVWLLGNVAWLVGIIDRSRAVIVDNGSRSVSIIQLGLVLFLFVGWLFLKPNRRINSRKFLKQDFWL